MYKDAVAVCIQERMTRVSNSSCLYRLSPGYTAHQLSIDQFLGQPIINKVLVSICSGNIFGLPKKSGSILGQIVWENWAFPPLAASRFYFRLNYRRRHSRYFFSKRYEFLFLFWTYFVFFCCLQVSFYRNTPFGGCGGPEKDLDVVLAPSGLLVPLPSDAAGQLDVFGHNGYLFCVDGAKVGILKKTH